MVAVLGLGCSLSVSETFLEVAARLGGKSLARNNLVCSLIAIPGFGGFPSFKLVGNVLKTTTSWF